MKKAEKESEKIFQVNMLSIKDNFIKKARFSVDKLDKIVRERVDFEYDLVDAEATYQIQSYCFKKKVVHRMKMLG